MKSFKDTEIWELEMTDKLYLFDNGEVKRYKFLSIHPNNDKYMILLDMCEQPVRFYMYSDYVLNNFFIDCTEKDFLDYKKSYYQRKLQEIEEEINKLNSDK